MSHRELTPAQAQAALQADPGLILLDVRTLPEYQEHRIARANLLPVQVLDQFVDRLDPARHYLVVCEHGRRSVAACEFLAAQGFTQLSNLTGGMAQWRSEGLPTEQGLPQSTRPGGGGCGNHCGCGKNQAASAPVEEPAAAAPQKKGFFRALFGR